MHLFRHPDLGNTFGDAKKRTHRGHLAKRHTCLCHAKRSGIHAYKEHAGLRLRSGEKGTMCAPRVLQWVVGERNRRSKVEQPTAVAQLKSYLLKRRG
jgi:hypothetical protein